MKAVASKTLSDKRMNLIRYLFSTGKHKKVLILGYSCSDEFDITPHIQSMGKNQKEIIFIKHSAEAKEEIEDIKTQEHKNPFKNFNGKRIRCDTNKFIKDFWNSFEDTIGEYEYKSIKSKVEWTKYIDDWSEILKENRALQYFISGLIFYSISDFKKSIEYYEISSEIVKETGHIAGEAVCYMNLGNAYCSLGSFKKAIIYHEKSLKIAKEIGDKAGESNCYTGLGIAYLGLGNFKKAIRYHKRSLKIKKEIGDRAGEALCYGDLGVDYHVSGSYEKAIEYYLKAEIIFKETGQTHYVKEVYKYLSIIYKEIGNYAKAEEYKKKIENIKAMHR